MKRDYGVAGIPGWSGVFERGTRPTGVHPLALIGAPPESRDWMVGDPMLVPVIHESALVDAFCTIDAGMPGLPATAVGARSWLQKRVHMGHNAVVGSDCEISCGVTICGEVTVGDGARIGGNAWIKPRVTIGEGAIIGGGSVVTRDVPAHEVWAGTPARFQKRAFTHPEYGYCACGCGERTQIATMSSSRSGWVKGEPKRYVHNHHTRRPARERFWEKVNVTTPEGCWDWEAKRNNKGYGMFWTGTSWSSAHRFSFELHNGEIPTGKIICHHCDNPRCVNPEHLYAGTYSDNMSDIHRRGRAMGGQLSPNQSNRARQFAGALDAGPQYELTEEQWDRAAAEAGVFLDHSVVASVQPWDELNADGHEAMRGVS